MPAAFIQQAGHYNALAAAYRAMISDKHLRRVLRSAPLVALVGDLIRALLVTAFSLVVLLAVAYDTYLARRMFGELHMNDFGRFYYSARAFLEGGSMYGPTPATAIAVGSETFHLWNMNPPHFHLLILPLAALAPLGAVVGWTAINAAALALSFLLIGRELQWRLTAARLAWIIAAIALASPTGIIVITGQLSFLLMLPMTLAWVDARHGRWTRAAILLGLVASMKPFIGIFGLYLLVTRRWTAAAAMIAAGAAFVAVGLAVFGWQAYADWMRAVGSVDWAFAPMNASIQGVLARTVAANPIFTPIAHAPSLVAPLSAALSLAIGTVALVVLARDRDAADVDRVFAGLLLTSLLASPLGWWYYAWLGAGPMAALAIRLRSPGSRLRDACVVAAVPGLILPLYVTTMAADSRWGTVTIGSTYAWTTLALWCGIMLDAGISARLSPGPKATASTVR